MELIKLIYALARATSEAIDRVDRAIEEAEDEEAKRRYREYREDLRGIAVAISALATKMAVDGVIDPKASHILQKMWVERRGHV